MVKALGLILNNTMIIRGEEGGKKGDRERRGGRNGHNTKEVICNCYKSCLGVQKSRMPLDGYQVTECDGIGSGEDCGQVGFRKFVYKYTAED
jgi:hypothetical protein